MVSAMDWNPYSKASVCCGQGRGESQSHMPAATPSPCPNNHSDPAAEVMDADKGGQLQSPGTPGFRGQDTFTTDGPRG